MFVCVVSVTMLLLVCMCHRYLVSEFHEHSCLENECVHVRCQSIDVILCSEIEELTKCYVFVCFGVLFSHIGFILFVTLLFPCLRVNHSWEQSRWIKEMIKKEWRERDCFCLLV